MNSDASLKIWLQKRLDKGLFIDNDNRDRLIALLNSL